MRPVSTRITFEIILGIVVAVALVIILRFAGRVGELSRQHEADVQSIRTLQDTLRSKGLGANLPGNVDEAPLTDHSGIAKREITIARLDQDLAESRATLVDLQSKLAAANDQVAKMQAGADDRAAKQQADAQTQIEELQKKLEAAQALSDIARQRASVLETDNAQLKTDSSAANARSTDVAQIVTNLQDLERRREVYLTNILRRYRDIGDEFHAMSSMMDNSHEPGSGACGGAALSRIQTAVTSAEDDMRQMSELNARTQKLQKQLSKK
jgi:uncharacterized phage infection (PIP) family protein YhgE